MHTVQAIAVVIANPLDASLVLTVLRPDDDEDLPGVWGLPATSIKHDESDSTAANRLGTRKLGTTLTLGTLLAEGTQERSTHHLAMRLYAASLGATSPLLPASDNHDDGTTYYTEWKWAARDSLREGARMGSLCCQLALQNNHKESV
jgi:ADP-ribose pyrophosphatase YjhB (NUDIX family)